MIRYVVFTSDLLHNQNIGTPKLVKKCIVSNLYSDRLTSAADRRKGQFLLKSEIRWFENAFYFSSLWKLIGSCKKFIQKFCIEERQSDATGNSQGARIRQMQGGKDC